MDKVEQGPSPHKSNLPGPMPYKLARFQKMLVKNPSLHPTDIALRIYDCKDRNSASAIASQNLRKLGISKDELMERVGLSDIADAEDLARLRKAKKVVSAVVTDKDAGAADKDFIEVDDNHTQFKALELTYKIKGAFNDDKRGVGDNTQNFLTIVENVNIANVQSDGKGIDIGREESKNFNSYLAK